MTKIIGITGGIGSGKTTLSNFLKKKGCPVHESDDVVKKMYNNPSKEFLDFVKRNVSSEAVRSKTLNKKIITKIIFNNKGIKKKLERFIHNEVRLSREAFKKKNLKPKNKALFFDVPLLFENKLEKNFDIILCVLSSKKNRTKRVIKKNKFSKETLNKIYKAQTTDKTRRAKSNIIITNNKTKKSFIFNVKKVLIEILKWERL